MRARTRIKSLLQPTQNCQTRSCFTNMLLRCGDENWIRCTGTGNSGSKKGKTSCRSTKAMRS